MEDAGTGWEEATVLEAGFPDEPLGLQAQPVGLLATGLASTPEGLVQLLASRPWKNPEQKLALEQFQVVEVVVDYSKVWDDVGSEDEISQYSVVVNYEEVEVS